MKQRVISAVIALAIAIPLLIIGGYPFYIGVAVLGVIGYRELMQIKEKNGKTPLLIIIISMFSFIFLMLSGVDSIGVFYMDYRVISLIVLANLLPLILYQDQKKYNIADALFTIGFILFLGTSLNYLITIRNMGLDHIIYILSITIFTDTFAYIVGTLIGKHKMCPKISPQKSYEGLIGGTIMGVFIGVMYYTTVFGYDGCIITLILATTFLSLVAQCGDLVFSFTKRYYNIKDFSNIMPGHGGILDRLDSIIFIVIAYGYVVNLL